MSDPNRRLHEIRLTAAVANVALAEARMTAHDAWRRRDVDAVRDAGAIELAARNVAARAVAALLDAEASRMPEEAGDVCERIKLVLAGGPLPTRAQISRAVGAPLRHVAPALDALVARGEAVNARGHGWILAPTLCAV